MKRTPGLKVWWVCVLSIALVVAGACGRAGPRGEGAGGQRDRLKWVRYQGDQGFSALIPEGWKVEVSRAGVVKLSDANAPVRAAYVWLGVLREQPDPRDLFRQVCTAGELGKGVFTVSTEEERAAIHGFLGAAEEYGTWKPVMVEILHNFSFDPELCRPGVLGAIELGTYVDPNERAFSVRVPRGWQVSGGVVRPYIDAWIRLEIAGQGCGILCANLCPPLFVTPSWVLEVAGFREGSWYNPGGAPSNMMVKRFLDAGQFVEEFLLPGLKQNAPGLALESVRARADIEALVPKNLLVERTSACEARFRDAAGRVHKCLVATQFRPRLGAARGGGSPQESGDHQPDGAGDRRDNRFRVPVPLRDARQDEQEVV